MGVTEVSAGTQELAVLLAVDTAVRSALAAAAVSGDDAQRPGFGSNTTLLTALQQWRQHLQLLATGVGSAKQMVCSVRAFGTKSLL